MAILGGDLRENSQIGTPYPHPKPLRVVAPAKSPLHGDYTDNSQIGPYRAENVSIAIDNTDLYAVIADLRTRVAALENA